ncbi:hypothetical protein [Pseudomonas aeruginosa]|uniref:hypothetical protein n=1 Tax=Pseudomonas aeruginosa TaxID=287 RepID=UPI000A98B447|nr:hypothetical protein [Pseudomonas aeruginosa]MCF8576635.1 hypothetical protein [Pseudomonas aeruginosa]MCG7143845.1 hypothetical protein [Pseudomonas aeruginosa]MCG7148696.1 hypothetical protein [Pseudomonas aeruginosa]MDI2414091.1 hypothetical protein [Pseudomonas aeruginosa]MUI99318.1 hypothetical protein [Pseudomonas aeruginosa]
MAGGERAGIAAIAVKVANELLPWLKWNYHHPPDQNFNCLQVAKHKQSKAEPDDTSEQKHNHPTDVVYSYIDPYTEKTVAINTDLKSYAKNSITQSSIRKSLKSLAHTIDCARYSDEWKERYSLSEENIEIRGMLFVYNHDGGWDNNFYDVFYGKKNPRRSKNPPENENDINISNIDLQANQQIHILEPKTIKYIKTVFDDLEKLDSRSEFNRKSYQFFYPDLNLHKTNNSPINRPATLELISAPFMIIEYQGDVLYNGNQEVVKRVDPGYKIYYKEKIESWKEIFFLLDSLSNYQMLNSNKKISVRAIAQDQGEMAQNHFRTAVQEYIKKWGKNEVLTGINFELIPTVSDTFSTQEIECEW